MPILRQSLSASKRVILDCGGGGGTGGGGDVGSVMGAAGGPSGSPVTILDQGVVVNPTAEGIDGALMPLPPPLPRLGYDAAAPPGRRAPAAEQPPEPEQ